MFLSFFPKPKLFFLSFALWALICVLGWYVELRHLGNTLSIGYFFGIHFPNTLAKSANTAEQAAFSSQQQTALNVWLYQYMAVCYTIFIGIWVAYSSQKWAKWSVIGSGLLVFVTWLKVQINVTINQWYGSFYDLIQKALSEPNNVTLVEFYSELSTFISIAIVAITVTVLNDFFVSHYVFRWRTAITQYYTSKWQQVRHIEGASQRIQEDTRLFAEISERLGAQFLHSVTTLFAFLPVLWTLSLHVKVLPLVGEVPQILVFVALLWAIIGTTLLAVAGIRLPSLNFKKQLAEAAYRKELVYGEDYEERARPVTLTELFTNVRKNYFRLYTNYLYFNIFRHGYLQAGILIPFITLGPSIVEGAFTLGIMERISNAFRQIESSFQFLISSWDGIIELLSIHKRLRTFEAAIDDQTLSS